MAAMVVRNISPETRQAPGSNDVKGTRQAIAAIITEPILCNCNCLMPSPGYLEGVRELATRFGVVLIFDEVITGFRVGSGGAQELFHVTPDLRSWARLLQAVSH